MTFMNKKKITAILYAVLAAMFYAVNMPASKVLLNYIEPTMMASLLYLGAGIGIGILFLMKKKNISKTEYLTKTDLPYTLGMIILDIIAPVLLMFGLVHTTSANASLLNNFEIVATTIIAMIIFKEMISKRLWVAISFYWGIVLLLGFVAYGLSIFFYICAQNVLGAAKTSAFYAFAPFIGVLLSVSFLHEQITMYYLIALVLMIIGTILIIVDTLRQNQE